jgi:prepilin-type processing-associated H-X9-DG protein
MAIVAILMAMLFPVFAQAREKARQTACLSNLFQIGMAIMMYVQDYDERMPPVWYRAAGADHYFLDVVQPYIANDQIFKCPSRPDMWESFDVHSARPWSYGFNCGFMGTVALAQINRPCEIHVVMDQIVQDMRTNAVRADRRRCNAARQSWSAHNGGFNILFADGHVKWLRGAAFFSAAPRPSNVSVNDQEHDWHCDTRIQ